MSQVLEIQKREGVRVAADNDEYYNECLHILTKDTDTWLKKEIAIYTKKKQASLLASTKALLRTGPLTLEAPCILHILESYPPTAANPPPEMDNLQVSTINHLTNIDTPTLTKVIMPTEANPLTKIISTLNQILTCLNHLENKSPQAMGLNGEGRSLTSRAINQSPPHAPTHSPITNPPTSNPWVAVARQGKGKNQES
jgi:hypothetical protein